VKGTIARASSGGNSADQWIVGGEARVQGEVAGKLQADLRPAAAASNFASAGEVQPLSGAAAHITHIAPPPTFAAQRDLALQGNGVVDVDQLVVEVRTARHSARGV